VILDGHLSVAETVALRQLLHTLWQAGFGLFAVGRDQTGPNRSLDRHGIHRTAGGITNSNKSVRDAHRDLFDIRGLYIQLVLSGPHLTRVRYDRGGALPGASYFFQIGRNPGRFFQNLPSCRFESHAKGHGDTNAGIRLDPYREMFGADVPDKTNLTYFSKV